MKLMHFRRLDPAYTDTGKVGLTRGNRNEKVVWDEFAGNSGALRAAAEAIRDAAETAATRARTGGR
jgi:hypothetical protein